MYEEVRWRWRYTSAVTGKKELWPGHFTAEWANANLPDAEPLEWTRQVVRIQNKVQELGKSGFGVVKEDEEK